LKFNSYGQKRILEPIREASIKKLSLFKKMPIEEFKHSQHIITESEPCLTSSIPDVSIAALIENRGKEVGICIFSVSQKKVVLTQLINDSSHNFSHALDILQKYHV
jgi:hypothetical protein